MSTVDVKPAVRLRLDRPTPNRRPGVIAGAAGMVLGCTFLAALVALRADQRFELLATTRRVPAGQAITDADLRVVRASGGGLPVIRATLRGRVVGRYAAVDLVPGVLLVPDLLADSGTPAPGEAVVAIVLRPEQLPAGGLLPGDRVRLVATGNPADDTTNPVVLAAAARVFTVTRRDAPGQDLVSVSVVVSEVELAGVARAASVGRVSVALLPRGTSTGGAR